MQAMVVVAVVVEEKDKLEGLPRLSQAQTVYSEIQSPPKSRRAAGRRNNLELAIWRADAREDNSIEGCP